MKVLWFTNIMLPELAVALGRRPEVVGGWMSALLDRLRQVEGIELAVATAIRGQAVLSRHVVAGVTYYGLPAGETRRGAVPAALLSGCERALADFRPAVVHVHGTEEAYGHVTAQLDKVPVVVSIQGLIHAYARHVPGGIRLTEAAECGIPGVLSWLRYELQRREWERRGTSERAIIAGNRNFIGRTAWDHAHVKAVNPAATYFHGEELLRSAFYQRTWGDRGRRPHTIFCTAAHSPLKGFHLVLDALSILRREFPEVTVRVAGAPWDAQRGFGYYGRFLKALIDRRGLSRHVVHLPSLDADAVADELARASAFVIPSLIDNSPNALAEAMLVGAPCVAALVGGIPSMIEDGRSALAFPSGDAECLAHCVGRLFGDAALSERLGAAARETALARHDPAAIGTRYMNIYQQLASGGPSERRSEAIGYNAA